MEGLALANIFRELSTPLVADACVRLKIPLRLAPPGIAPVASGQRLAGPVLPVRHYGSVDIFLEVMEESRPGEILVIDNGGRRDEGCVGDLIVREARACGLGGVVIWGAHRDSLELLDIGFPVFSYGTSAAGPQRLDPAEPEALTLALCGDVKVTREDVAFGDLDGIIFVPLQRAAEVLEGAESIRKKESAQAARIAAGVTLREQLAFSEYLRRRRVDPSYNFRQHLRIRGGAIEE